METSKWRDNQRGKRLALLIVGGFALLIGYNITTDNPTVEAIIPLYLGLWLVGLLVWPIVIEGVPKRARWPEIGAFAIAGVAKAYAGLSALSIVPTLQSVSTVGDVVLLVGGVLILYRIGFGPETVE
jgi:hypothetical protein